MAGIKTLSIIIAANIKGLESSMKKADKTLAGFASRSARLGSMLSFGITAPLTALGKQAFDTFVDFENGMTKVGTVTGATAEEMSMLTAEAKKLGATTQFTASQVADLQLVLGRKGFDPTAIKEMEGSILDLALATGEDLSLAAETVSTSLNAFNLQSSEAGRIANTLASAAANSSIQLNTFATAFGHAGASANAVGVEVEELSAMMGVLMDNGIKASKAGTGLRKAFIELNEEGIPFGNTLDMLASGQMSLNDASELVGKTAANQLLILSKNRNKVKELTKEYRTNTTRLDEMADAMGQTSQAKIKKMQSAIEGLQLVLGGLMSDFLTPLIERITDLANKFSNLDKKTQKIILVAGALVAAIGPVLLIFGGLGGMLAAGAAAVSPFILAFAKIALITVIVERLIFAIGSLVALAVDNAGALKDRMSNMANSIANFFIRSFNKTVKFLSDMAAFYGVKLFENFTPAEELELIPDDELTKFVDGVESFKNYSKEYDKLKGKMKDGLTGLFDFGLGSGSAEVTSPVKDLTEDLEELQDLEDELDEDTGLVDSILATKQAADEAALATQRFLNGMKSFAEGTAIAFADSFGQVIVSGENLLQGLTKIFVDIAKQIAAMIVKALVLAAIFQFIPGFGGGKLFDGAKNFTGILGSLMGGAFADGGNPPLGKVSLVGEKGPELFVPNSSGTIVPNNALGGMGGTPDVRISGDDLLIVFDKAQRRRDRR